MSSRNKKVGFIITAAAVGLFLAGLVYGALRGGSQSHYNLAATAGCLREAGATVSVQRPQSPSARVSGRLTIAYPVRQVEHIYFFRSAGAASKWVAARAPSGHEMPSVGNVVFASGAVDGTVVACLR